ncbi:MAG TPA: TonB-dependent receptor [Steroidobacteraceae bacterium]|nr:TonB-dependent receptor [Steroidobacteraceae bacterium]
MKTGISAYVRSVLLASAALSLQVGSPHAAAADETGAAAGSGDELEEIVVTAQKRAEKLQDIPVAATAITATDIERAGVNNIQDVAQLTPNLVIIDQLRPGIQTVSFRGFTTVQGGQSPFAIVVDGVAEPGQEFLKQQLIDVQQIEVLRGPQGTLYGAGAIAGAINIVTKQPTNDFEGSAKIGYAQGNQSTGELTLSGPIIPDKVFFRASAYSDTFNGLIPNEAAQQYADFVQERAFNGELLLKPTDDLSIDLRGHVTNGTYGALWLVPVSDSEFDDFNINPDENVPGIDRRHLQTYSAKIDYRLPGVTLTSITAYNNAEQYATADGDFSPASVFAQTWLNNTNAWSEEFRLTSNVDGPLKWNLGVFAQDYRVEDATTFYSVDPSSPFLSATDDHYDNRSWAVFGQASYDFDPHWTLTAGARYDRVNAYLNDTINDVQSSHTFSQPQPKATLSYKLTPDIMAYVTYGKGFRTGGFNPATPLSLRLYQNEVSSNYEAGVKATLLDNRLILNAAGFHTDFTNQQFFFSEATSEGIYRAIINIPKTKVNGAEFEAQARATQWLKLLASVGYNNTSISEFADSAYNGKRTPQVYGLTTNLSAEATQAVGTAFRLVGRIDYEHRGDVYWDLANQLRTPAKNFVNGRLAFERGDGLWSLAVYCHNLTNERTPAAVGADAAGNGISLRSANEPRQTGVELQARF